MKQKEIKKRAEEYNRKQEEDNAWEDYDEQAVSDRKHFTEKAWKDGAKWGMEHAIEWHDMIANPDDLPKKTDEYWVKYSDGSYGIATYFADGSNYHDYIWRCLIAWCELPQFKDKE